MQEKNLQKMFQIQDMAGSKIIADSAKTGEFPSVGTCGHANVLMTLGNLTALLFGVDKVLQN